MAVLPFPGIFSSEGETTPDSIPANSIASFLFLFRCHIFLVAGRRRAQPEPLRLRTLPDRSCVSHLSLGGDGLGAAGLPW